LTQTDQTSAQGNVGVFLDGIYLNNRSALEFGAIDLARIEVVKGPQSALYGRNTFGGAINYVTKSADLDRFGAKVEGSYGNRGFWDVQGNLNLPIGGVAAIQAFFGTSEFDGTIANNGPGDRYLGGWTKREAFGGKLYIEPADNLRLTFFGMRTEQQNDQPALSVLNVADFQGGNLSYGCTPIGTGAGGAIIFAPPCNSPGPFQTLYGRAVPTFREIAIFPGKGLEANSTLFYGKLEYDLPFATVSALYGRLRANSELRVSTNNLVGAINIPGPVPGGSSAAVLDASTPKGDSDSVEIKLAQNNGGFDWMLGGFYSTQTDSDVLRGFWVPLGGVGEPIFFFGRDRVIDTKTYAAFGSVSAEIGDRLTLSAELRYSEDHLTFVNAAGQPKRSFKYWTPRFIADFKVTPDMMIYANVGRGYKVGGFGGQINPGTGQQTTFNEETNWSFEIGMKGKAFNDKLQYQVAAYYILWDDVQIQAPLAGSFISVVQNSGSITSRGIEMDVSYNVTDNFKLRASGAVLDPTYDKGFIEFGALVPCGESINTIAARIITKGCTAGVGGNTVARTSRFQGSVSAVYEVPDVISDFGAYLRADYSYQSPKNSTGLDTDSQGPISLANARFGLRNEKFEVAFWVDNLFDQEWNRRVTVSPEGAFGGQATGVQNYRVFAGDLRTFGMDVSVKF
jgi:iron complex outermembrane recepter protein